MFCNKINEDTAPRYALEGSQTHVEAGRSLFSRPSDGTIPNNTLIPHKLDSLDLNHTTLTYGYNRFTGERQTLLISCSELEQPSNEYSSITGTGRNTSGKDLYDEERRRIGGDPNKVGLANGLHLCLSHPRFIKGV